MLRDGRISHAEQGGRMSALARPVSQNSTQKTEEKPVRRRNVDRSAATRKVILEATISCLHRLGYGAVTNHTVADLAGVSRGAMMHHFPTRQALLVATIEYSYAKLRKHRVDFIDSLEPGLPRYRALIDLAWANAQLPEDIACNEIRVGSRSDPEIAASITPIMIKTADDFARYIGGVARQAGLEPDEELKGLTATTAMAMRAMAVNLFTYPRTQIVDSVINSLKLARERLIARQLGEDAALDLPSKGAD
jgi:AcrR family transcriptional regulator